MMNNRRVWYFKVFLLSGWKNNLSLFKSDKIMPGPGGLVFDAGGVGRFATH